MNFDSVITFFLILAFFILPGILKQIKAAKAKNTIPGKSKKKPSLFYKIGEKMQQFVSELEQQEQQRRETSNDLRSQSQNRPDQNRPNKNQPNQNKSDQNKLWDAFKEDEASHFDFETLDQEDSYFVDQELKTSKSEPLIKKSSVRKELIDSSRENRKIKNIKKPVTLKTPTIEHPIPAKYIFKTNPLQNAVIWSEILGKPVGLRQ